MLLSSSRRRASVAALVVSGALAACGGGADDPAGSATSGGTAAGEAVVVTIGSNFELTGRAASVGVPWSEGLELAVAQVNELGIEVAGRPLRFEVESLDNQTDPERAIGNMQELVDSGVQFIFGPGSSAMFVPAYESVAGEDLEVFTAAAAATGLLSEEPGLIRVAAKVVGEDGGYQRTVGVLVDEYDPQTVAILVTRDDTGRINAEEYTEAFERHGVEVVYSDSFPVETRDFAPFITAMAAEDPDLVVSGNIDALFEPFLTQAIQAGFTGPVFHGLAGVTDASSEGKTDLQVNWLLQSADVVASDDPGVVAWRELYAEHFGREVTPAASPALTFYEPVLMLARAMEATGSTDDVAAIDAALRSGEIADYEGRVTDLAYDELGQANVLMQVAIREGSSIRYVDAAG